VAGNPEVQQFVDKALVLLGSAGLLMISDGRLESIAGLVTGGPVRGSWWGHERGKEIYATAEIVTDHKDVVVVKLVSAKLTCVHRIVWPALIAVATAGEDWQRAGLSDTARELLQRVEKAGELEPLPPKKKDADPRLKAATLELEERLCLLSRSVHTSSGAHAKGLESWAHWASRAAVKGPRPTAAQARAALEESARHLDPERRLPVLPWNAKRGR
jgi:hypothetical protein